MLFILKYILEKYVKATSKGSEEVSSSNDVITDQGTLQILTFFSLKMKLTLQIKKQHLM